MKSGTTSHLQRHDRPVRNGRTAWQWLLLIHVLVVGLLTLLSVGALVAGYPNEDANIGAGLAALPLIPLGMPWWLVVLVPGSTGISDDDPWPWPWWTSVLHYAYLYGPAWINVGIHALLVRRFGGRRASAPDVEPSTV